MAYSQASWDKKVRVVQAYVLFRRSKSVRLAVYRLTVPEQAYMVKDHVRSFGATVDNQFIITADPSNELTAESIAELLRRKLPAIGVQADINTGAHYPAKNAAWSIGVTLTGNTSGLEKKTIVDFLIDTALEYAKSVDIRNERF